MKLKCTLTILVLFILVPSCNQITPANFWLDFHKDLITSKSSDQGPWGGTRQIAWHNTSENFLTSEIIEFAKKNEWSFVDSTTINSDSTLDNNLSGLEVDSYTIELLRMKILPHLKSKENSILVFKTTWVILPGYDVDETFQNGFAIVNSEKSKLKIFHFWGE